MKTKRFSISERLKYLLDEMQLIIKNHTSDDGEYLRFHSKEYERKYEDYYKEYCSLLGE